MKKLAIITILIISGGFMIKKFKNKRYTNIYDVYTKIKNNDFSFKSDNITPNFTWGEAFKNLANDDIKTASLSILGNISAMSNRMEEVRNLFGKPITVNSWYRSPRKNWEVGGADNSQHLSGNAVDFNVLFTSAEKVQKTVKNAGWIGGIGYYSSFTHLDNRGYLAQWGAVA